MKPVAKLMDYLARRSHSELELREKLSRHFSQEEIDTALDHARDKGWLEQPEALSNAAAETLSRKGKGQEYINAYLKKKGLPAVTLQSETELRKGLRLAQKHLNMEPPFSYEDKKAIFRLLKNRGFDHDTIQKLLDDSF